MGVFDGDYTCDGQIDISQIELLPADAKSKCLDCFWECKGFCACWHSRYEDMHIPMNGCEFFDGIAGGLPSIEELKGMA